MPENVIIIGAGGHAKVIADIVIKSGSKLLGFLDDFSNGRVIENYSVLGKIPDCIKFGESAEFIIAIGDNKIRRDISEKYSFLNWHTAVHPSAQIGIGAEIGAGTVIMPNAVIGSCAVIGQHCIINTAAVIEHDNYLNDYVHVSPNATLCGTVTIGEMCHIGACAVLKNNISVCSNVTVGVGAAVTKNITVSGVYVGVPAKQLSKQ